MHFLQPAAWAEALEARAGLPDGLPVAGATDLLVELTFHRCHPVALIDLGRVPGLDEVSADDGWLRLGATATYEHLIPALRRDFPALALAARTVGSPPIRRRGTIGGNLGTASPAGDVHPPLLAAGAQVEAASVAGTRRIAITDFFTGPKQNALAPDELISAVYVPRATGPQQFAKVGPRNAMVIAVCSFALALHPDRRRVGTGIGSAGPVPLAGGRGRALPGGRARRGRPVGGAPAARRRRDEHVRRSRRVGGPAGRRRARDGRLPRPGPARHRRPGPRLGLGRLPEGGPRREGCAG